MYRSFSTNSGGNKQGDTGMIPSYVVYASRKGERDMSSAHVASKALHVASFGWLVAGGRC
jgi:hypothetical protein